nr:hypothetical protein HmN_000533300 [Hymenolepis microstoma]
MIIHVHFGPILRDDAWAFGRKAVIPQRDLFNTLWHTKLIVLFAAVVLGEIQFFTKEAVNPTILKSTQNG